MTIHILNCFTCNARIPRHWHTGTLDLLFETEQGLVLVDTGPGTDDYVHHSSILKVFRVIMRVPLDPQEAAIRQIARLGYKPEDVRNIVLTHMHFDHCGGLPDFPKAKIHVYRREYEAFTGKVLQWSELAYVRRHIAHGPDWALYDDTGEKWFEFGAIRLPFEPEMWLVPIPGHTRGLCGVAIKTSDGWLFNASDAAALFNQEAPDWVIKLALGPHQPRIRQFPAAPRGPGGDRAYVAGMVREAISMKINLRPIIPSDEPFLWEILYQALYVPPGKPAFSRDILREPDIACYVQGWGRPGDWGRLACDGETPVGAVWLRQWSSDEKGYGYVSPAIPELSIAILPEYRNMGLGTRMIKTVISMARERFPGLSLSVVESSPARRLYERLGFRTVGQVGDSPVMLLEWGNHE